jgi:outer membrane beta-barrel protein
MPPRRNRRVRLAAIASAAASAATTLTCLGAAHAETPTSSSASAPTSSSSTTATATAAVGVAPIPSPTASASGTSTGTGEGAAKAGAGASGCVDEALKEELVGGRHYRGVQDRLFTKALRHELSIFGGIYAADLYSSNFTYGAAYTFHFSEDLGLEASMQLTRFRSQVTDAYEQRYPQIQIEDRTDKPGRLYFGHLVYSFAYGKLRWAGGGITHFDFNAALGAGVTDDTTARGITGSAGLGTKWYFGDWFAIRMDIRDHVLSESLVGEEHLVNDVIATAGISVFFPFTK